MKIVDISIWLPQYLQLQSYMLRRFLQACTINFDLDKNWLKSYSPNRPTLQFTIIELYGVPISSVVISYLAYYMFRFYGRLYANFILLYWSFRYGRVDLLLMKQYIWAIMKNLSYRPTPSIHSKLFVLLSKIVSWSDVH